MGQMRKIGRVATTVATDDMGMTRVTYHSTVVAAWNNGTIRLNSGGWHTVTTKNRMNQASNQYGLGYQVFQRNHDWFVAFNGKDIPFEDGMILVR